MNNATIYNKKDIQVVSASNLESAKEKVISGDDNVEISSVLKNIEMLQKSTTYLKHTEQIINPQIQKKIHALEKEKDPVEIYRLQGYIDALNWIKNFEALKKLYKAKLEKNYERNNNKEK